MAHLDHHPLSSRQLLKGTAMFESYSWLGVTLALFVGVVSFAAAIMLVVDIYKEYKFRRTYRKAPHIVGRWEKIGHANHTIMYSNEVLTLEEVARAKAALRKGTVYDWKKEAPNDFS